MSKLMDKVVQTSIGLFIASILVPMALVQMANASFTGVDATVVTVVQVLLPVLAAFGIALAFMRADD